MKLEMDFVPGVNLVRVLNLLKYVLGKRKTADTDQYGDKVIHFRKEDLKACGLYDQIFDEEDPLGMILPEFQSMLNIRIQDGFFGSELVNNLILEVVKNVSRNSRDGSSTVDTISITISNSNRAENIYQWICWEIEEEDGLF